MLSAACVWTPWFSRETLRAPTRLLDRLVVDVVLDGVLLRELVDDVHSLAVRVVDLDERVPLVGKRVLREDRLDRALRFAGAAITSHDPTGQCERVFAGNNGAEDIVVVLLDRRHAHHAP